VALSEVRTAEGQDFIIVARFMLTLTLHASESLRKGEGYISEPERFFRHP
jgi:hypothetical protein